MFPTDQASVNRNVKVKWDHQGVYRRFEVPLQSGYVTLMKKVNAVVPDFNDQLVWKGYFCYLSIKKATRRL